jgi:nitrile hydratase accessory protein
MPSEKALHAIPDLPRDQDGPVFNEPWEAEAFALAVHLSEAGHFTWSEWVQVFSAEIAAAQVRGDPNRGNTYYHHWLNALERICAVKGLVEPQARQQRRDQWYRAYLNTPHGHPVELSAAAEPEAQ